MQSKSFLNHISIGGFNLGEAIDPGNHLDQFSNAVQSGDLGGIIEAAGNMLDGLEDRYDQATDLLEDLIATGKKDKQVDLDDIRARRTRIRQTRRKMASLQKRIANERRLEDIEARLTKLEDR